MLFISVAVMQKASSFLSEVFHFSHWDIPLIISILV